MVHYKLNNELNGIELYFDGIFPNEKLRTKMKSLKLRWNPKKKCWYTKQYNEEGVKFIKEYCAKHGFEGVTNTKPKETITFKPVKRCCYSDLIENFYNENKNDFIEDMESIFKKEVKLELSQSQINAWADSFDVMQKTKLNPNISIIFEYILPYESGRRPDIILLTEEQLLVLEFKMKNEILNSDIDQVSAYVRDLKEYHYESRDKEILPLLVLTRSKGIHEKRGNVICVSSDLLQEVLDDIYQGPITQCDFEKWVLSKYEPLPTIVEAARNFMNKEDLPNIRRVNSTCIPQTIESLKNITNYAKNNKKHVIAFVTGVPGAGKTYLGLQYVYDITGVKSVYLSGNGPLVKVLTDALKSKTFVRNLHTVVNEYIYSGAPDFNDNIVVFDEGQRAWDVEQMQTKKNYDLSEPEVMVKLCEERLDWCVLLILVGEGQEIYNGENSGIGLWDHAISESQVDWEVICPPKLFSVFEKQNILDNVDNSSFDLTVSLRSHLSGTVSEFVNLLIDGEIEKAASLTNEIYGENYNMYCTRNLESAKEYCRNRYAEEPEKRFGLISSSKGRILKSYGMDNSYNGTKGTNFGKWFNAPFDDPKSCCALKQVVTEFGVQGLELDMPIIGWDNDMLWNGSEWKKFKANEDINSDANTYRRNSYRVLLTRGRDGFIIFVPPETELDSVYGLLLEVGIKELN